MDDTVRILGQDLPRDVERVYFHHVTDDLDELARLTENPPPEWEQPRDGIG